MMPNSLIVDMNSAKFFDQLKNYDYQTIDTINELLNSSFDRCNIDMMKLDIDNTNFRITVVWKIVSIHDFRVVKISAVILNDNKIEMTVALETNGTNKLICRDVEVNSISKFMSKLLKHSNAINKHLCTQEK